MPTANVNGQSIRFDDSGGDGPPIIFSHGFLMDRTMFADQVESLRDSYRCITWDERGFGETPATGPFTYWDSARDALALLDHLGIDSAVFVGMSQGGFLSLRAALLEPERVRALVLIDSQAGVDDAETLEGYRGMIAHWKSGQPLGEVGQMVAGLILGEPNLMQKWIQIWESRDRDGIEYPAGALLDRDDITDRLAEIACPVLSIHGEQDMAITMDRAEALQAAVSHARGLVKVPGAAHAPNMTHPQIVNPALGAFLDSLEQR
ncbi:MAG: alpha/beta hydrolase [Acidimicrobiales bacterium]|nr:alpha/beta hydrolase [Acidimicrobiales bacterium]